MSIPMNAECYLCQLKRSIEIARGYAGEKGADIMAKKLMPIFASAPDFYSSPMFEPAVTKILEDHCGLVGDRFRAEKDLDPEEKVYADEKDDPFTEEDFEE